MPFACLHLIATCHNRLIVIRPRPQTVGPIRLNGHHLSYGENNLLEQMVNDTKQT